MHFDDEAGEDAFGHEAFVAVSEGEVAIAVPGDVGGCGGEEVGGDVVTGAAGDFVADFEFFHELEEFWVEVVVLGVAPDVGEVGFGELSEVGADAIVVEDFVDGGGAPVGFEDEGLVEDFVGLEVETGAEAVEEAAETEHFNLVCDVVAAAGGLVFLEGDGVAVVVFEAVADVEPFVGEGESVADEGFEVGLDGAAQCGEVAIVF